MNKFAFNLMMLALAAALLSGCTAKTASNGGMKSSDNYIKQELEAEPAFLYLMEEDEPVSAVEDDLVLENHEYTDQNVQQQHLEGQYQQEKQAQ